MAAKAAPAPRFATGRVLIVAAWEPELARLHQRLASSPAARVNVTLATVGVGSVEAGIGTTRAIADTRPAAVVLVGTAGAYSGMKPILRVGSVALVDVVRLASSAVCRDQAYYPPPLRDRVDLGGALSMAIGDASGESIISQAVCPLGITKGPEVAQLFSQDLGRIENLEAFGVVRAAELHGLPSAVVVGISNRVGPRAHREWLAHGKAAAGHACDAVFAWLRVRERAARGAVNRKNRR